jgi:hypothetical protein
MLSLPQNAVAVVSPPAVQIDAHISYGQSWRSNGFLDFNSFGLNPNGPTALLVASLGAFLGPGPMPGSAGISLSGLPTGTTNYKGNDYFMVGRCAILTQQLLRIRDGQSPPQVLEFCTAYPGSTWHSGGGGGLAPGSSFVGSISGLTLTVESLTSGYVAGGQPIVAAGVNAQTRVYANLTLAADAELPEHLRADNPDDLGVQQLTPGGVGTYQLALTFTSIATTFTGTSPAASFTASANQGVLTVTAIASGSLAVNQVISGGVLPVGSIIQQQLSGVSGGLGTYLLGLPQTVTSRAMLGQGVSWTNMVAILNAIPPGRGAFPTINYTNMLVSSVGYTQGGSVDNTNAGKVADLADMTVQFDALNLNPTPLKFYYGLPAAISTATTASDTNQGTYTFCRTHAPGMGGTYSGRVFATGPSYPYQFNGGDNIHTGDYGSSRWGEIEGYARWCVQDKGVQWTPLWRPLTGGAITVAGQVITVPFARPTGPDFAAGVMSFQSNADDGIKTWPQNGFHVKRGSTDLTVTPAISGMNVLLTIAETISVGDTLEVSYAWYGPGGPNPGISSGVGGNLVMRGPPSVLYPNGWNGVAKTIECWAWPFVETLTI